MSENILMHDDDSEKALLGACLWAKNARVEARKVITGSDFYVPAHEKIWDAMTRLDREGHTVDLVTVLTVLKTLGQTGTSAVEALIGINGLGVASSAGFYAETVHEWAVRRRLHSAARGLMQRALEPGEPAGKLATQAVTILSGIRDGRGGDTTAMGLDELMAVPDDTPTWVIPGLLERSDRFMLTGTEGVGKSALSRQISIMAAAGLHPFTNSIIPPQKVLLIDAENKDSQIKRQTRPLLEWLARNGAADPSPNVMVDALAPRRINLTNDRDLSMIHQTIDAFQPSIVVIGPIYKMSPKALQTDDDAHPFLAALDTITERGCALIVEAHAGHAQETTGNGRATARQLRPRGSSALIGWPEFGMGLRNLGHGYAELERWRGDREVRGWPTRMKRSAGNRWIEVNPDERPMPPTAPPPPPDPQGSLDDGWNRG